MNRIGKSNAFRTCDLLSLEGLRFLWMLTCIYMHLHMAQCQNPLCDEPACLHSALRVLRAGAIWCYQVQKCNFFVTRVVQAWRELGCGKSCQVGYVQIYLFICLFIYFFIYLFIYLCIYLFIFLFLFLFIYLFIYFLIYLFIYIYIMC